MSGNQAWESFIRGLVSLGGSSGNARLRAELGWNESVYEQVKAQLIEAGLVVPGRGRGGSVALGEGLADQFSNLGAAMTHSNSKPEISQHEAAFKIEGVTRKTKVERNTPRNGANL